MKGHWIVYSDVEMAWLTANRLMPIGDYHAGFCAAFGRQEVSAIHLASLRKRKGWRTGRTGRFERGQVPFNKGTHFCPPGSEKGQFKKGQLPHNTKYLGHERLSKDGYVEISVAETSPYTGFNRRYVQKHRYLWEKLNGAVPKGMVLKSVDGDRLNTAPENWIPISRGLLPRLAGGRHEKHIPYDGAPPELKPTLMAVAQLEGRARAVRQNAHDGAAGEDAMAVQTK